MLLILLCCFYGSSHQRCSVRKYVRRNFAKFTGKHLYQSLVSIKLQAWGLQLYHLYVAVRLVTVHLWAAAGRLPRLVRRKVAMLRAFTVGLLESSKNWLLFLAVLPGLIDTLAQLLAWRSLLWLSMTWRRRYLTQSHFLSTASLDWSLVLHLLFCSVRRSLYGGRKFWN